MPRRDSIFARSLEPLFTLLLPLFLVWTVVVALIWISGIDDSRVATAVANPGLREALRLILRSSDTFWLLLATANLYLALAERVGLATARLWAVAIFATGALIALASVHAAWPLGQVFYTTRLGMKFGPVPLGWPLWWFVVVIGGRALAERLLLRASHSQLAIATGVIALITQLNFEPLAWKVRLFWFWYAPGTHLGPPLWRNYATWWLAATALAFLLRERQVAATAPPRSWHPAQILIAMNAVFFLTHIAEAVRG